MNNQFLVENAWRSNLWSYAHKLSNGNWIPYKALTFIANAVQEAIMIGNQRIIINIPPRMGKTELIAKWLPLWFLDIFPQKRIILSSYAVSLAEKSSRMVRDTISSNNLIWSKIGKKDTAVEWETTEGGGMLAAGVGGSILGYGADLFLIDDPHKNREEAFSDRIREEIIEWFKATAQSRLEPNATMILIMQRWHERDLSGFLLHEHPANWIHIKLPMEAEENDLLGRKPGEVLIPERYSKKDIEIMKRDRGSLVWAGMYQQRPAPADGNIIMRDWILYYTIPPINVKNVTISWDMSFKKEGKSWCVGQAWFRKGSRHYLMDQVRGKWDFTTALKKVIAFHNHCTDKWGNVRKTYIEEAANGIAIINTVKGYIPRIKPIKASVSKTERLSNAAPTIECGDAIFPHRSIAPWIDDLIEELVIAPNGTLDDQCDALSQYINNEHNSFIGNIKLNLDIGIGAPVWRI